METHLQKVALLLKRNFHYKISYGALRKKGTFFSNKSHNSFPMCTKFMPDVEETATYNKTQDAVIKVYKNSKKFSHEM